eukprot:snap_masked-scaffold_124-processed-gene-0.7-mRNA-1 protein AED:1.00 eAED:1.00 QI:0/0/0/0/1/1/2/0/222
MEQKQVNDQLQDILRMRQEELNETEAAIREQKTELVERLSNLPETYENAAEKEALEHRKYDKEVNTSKGVVESAMSHRSLDPWSETGSSYIDENANKKGYMYDYKQRMVVERRPSGVPLLKELPQKPIINCLHNFDGIATNIPNLNIQALLTEGVTSSLRHRGVDVTSPFSIHKYLKKHVSKFDRINRARCLTTPAEELEWPSRSYLLKNKYIFISTVLIKY